MKLIFTADWHIKLGQKNVPKDWQRSRIREFYKQLFNYIKTEEVDFLVVGGDVFDKVPTLEELELFYEFVVDCPCDTFIIPGNHEALKKNTTFLSYLKNSTYKLNSKVRIIDDYATIHGIDFIPYNKLKCFTQDQVSFDGIILVTHVRGEIPPHVKPEVDLALFSKWKTVLAGDLHSYDNSQLNILYPGSPITTSFHRGVVSTGVISYNTDTHDHRFLPLDLPQLLKKTVSDPSEMVKTDYHHTIYELEGELTDLAKVQNTELLDKKIITRDSSATLSIKQGMTIQEELAEYLSVVLGLNDANVQKILFTFNDFN